MAKQVRAAVYTRISDDATGQAAGVTRQRADCEEYCARRGWTIVAHYEDNDVSASEYSRKKRTGYQAMIAAVRAGEIDAIVAWHLDRLYRQVAELEEIIRIAENLTVATINGDVDLATGDGKAMARIIVTMAQKASDDTSRRMLRLKDELARQGRPAGGAPVFGYRLVRDGRGATYEVIPSHAAEIRAAAAAVLAGESLSAIARDWTARGVEMTRAGKVWSATHVRRILASPRIIAKRVHRGQVVGDAAWEPILDEETWQLIQAVLGDPRRAEAPKATYLLSRLVVCGTCGKAMVRDRTTTRAVWRCQRRPFVPDACGRMIIPAVELEDWVETAFLTRVAADQVRPHIAGTDTGDITARLAHLESTGSNLVEMLGAGEITRADFAQAKARNDAEQFALKAKLLRARPGALRSLRGDPAAIRRTWDGLTVAQRRAALADELDRVVVNASEVWGSPWESARVDPVWKD